MKEIKNIIDSRPHVNSSDCGCKDHDDEIEISRRKFLSIGMALSTGLIFTKFGLAKNVHSKFPELSFMNPLSAQADSVIVLWMAGGPSQFETRSEERRVGEECRSRWCAY